MGLDNSVGQIITVSADNLVSIAQNKPDDYWNNGVITIEGESRMIRKSEGRNIKTYYPFFATIAEGMNYSIHRGCDKTFNNCNKYNNLEHFTGFPSIPFESIYR